MLDNPRTPASVRADQVCGQGTALGIRVLAHCHGPPPQPVSQERGLNVKPTSLSTLTATATPIPTA